MVHSGGQHGRGLRPGHWRRHYAVVPLIAVLALTVAPAPAAAQAAIGFHGGFAVDPEQVVGGVFLMSPDIGRGIRLRPGIDGGTGDGLRIATIHVDFLYGYPLGANGWTLVAGGGPSVVITRIPDIDFRDTGVGFHSVLGFGHDRGFFTEVRLGSGKAQQLKLIVGWALALN